MKKLQFAKNYATTHHANQMYGDKPYVFHLDAVYSIVKEFSLGEDYEIAAYLHDLLEDTKVTKKELNNLFGEHIANMVDCVSGFGENRKGKQHNIKSKMLLYPSSINLKMADRLANMRNSKLEKPKLYKLYCKEHEEFKIIFLLGNTEIFNVIEEVAGVLKIKKGPNV